MFHQSMSLTIWPIGSASLLIQGLPIVGGGTPVTSSEQVQLIHLLTRLLIVEMVVVSHHFTLSVA